MYPFLNHVKKDVTNVNLFYAIKGEIHDLDIIFEDG